MSWRTRYFLGSCFTLFPRHEAERLEQESRGKLERQRIKDEAVAEEARKVLLELQIQLAALESTGQAKAEAQSQAEAALIASESAVKRARLEAEAEGIRAVLFQHIFKPVTRCIFYRLFDSLHVFKP